MIGFHGLNNSYMFEDEQIGTYRPKIEEIINRTPKGRVATDFAFSHFNKIRPVK